MKGVLQAFHLAWQR